MKAYDFEAVVYDGSVYCVECLPEGIGVNSNDVSPIFADSEWDTAPVCEHCGAVHDYMTILEAGNGPSEPKDGDLTTEDHETFYQDGQVCGGAGLPAVCREDVHTRKDWGVMTKREALRQTEQERALMSLGFTREEAIQLRRISTTLRRWYELECGADNGGVERDETTGKTFWYWSHTGKRTPYPDRETGAVERLKAIIGARNGRCYKTNHSYLCPNDPRAGFLVSYYLQTDPRGAALYILRPGDVPEGKDVQAYYDRGICVY